jgi:AcrR family transcriptional regulator
MKEGALTKVRTPLSSDRIIKAAMALADERGLAALTMRSLADELEVTPMSLYRYIDSKEALLVAMVDVVFEETDAPTVGNEWRQEMWEHAHSIRHTLLQHPWALGLVETPTQPGPATVARHDAVIGTFRAAGFPIPLTAHALAAFDAYIYGFVLQEVTLPLKKDQTDHETIQAVALETSFGGLPHLKELTIKHFIVDGYRFGDEFEFGLALVLDGLANHLSAVSRT